MKAEPKLGELITGEEHRDAIHIAICPVIADHNLNPGQQIGIFSQNGEEIVVGVNAKKYLGIVDPFLKTPINKGEKFWMFLFPNTITSLRHEWTHPNFHYDKK